MAAEQDLIENFTFDELPPGRRAQAQRALAAADIEALALVSGDAAHTTLAGAWLASVVHGQFPGPGTVCLEQTVHYERAVQAGDVLAAVLQVESRDASARTVVLTGEVRNQQGQVVARATLRVRPPLAKTATPRNGQPTMHLFDPEGRLQAWMQAMPAGAPLPCAVVHPCDEGSLRGALDSAAQGWIRPLLVGPAARLRALADALALDLGAAQVVDVPHSHAAAATAAALAARGEAAMLMKGSLHTDEMMAAVIAEPLLRTGRRMSHVFRFEVPAYPKPLLVTDAALNIRPNVDEKADIIRNAVALAQVLGVAVPHVALLSAVETVTARIPSTLDAAALCKMADRGQISGAVLDGPLAFDNAISAEAARIKGITSPVAGRADILVVPDLESGNMLAKQLEYLAGAASCGVVLGARVPIALTSRADTATSRAASTMLAALVARASQ